MKKGKKKYEGILLIILLTSGFILLSSCSEDNPTEPDSVDISGVYNLITVNDNSLPYIFFENQSQRFEVLSSSWTLNSDNSYEKTERIRETKKYYIPPLVTIEDYEYSGIYSFSVNDSIIIFTSEEGTQYTAIIDGNTLINGSYKYVK